MESSVKSRVKAILEAYLEENGQRKTPERFAILESAYGFDGCFSIVQLSEALESKSFRVSRATLYNSLKLFMELRLVVRHRFGTETLYEPCHRSTNHCRQICTVCGKVTNVKSAEIDQAVDTLKLHRFRKDGYTLYVYGICATCQTKMTKRKTKNIRKNK